MSYYQRHVFFCVNDRGEGADRPSCNRCGAQEIRDYAKAREIYAGLTEQAIVDRIDGKKVPDANVHVELPGYQDAKFVYVNRLSKDSGIFDFLTRTETGWAGDFNALYPNSNYEIVVDGVVVKRRYDQW